MNFVRLMKTSHANVVLGPKIKDCTLINKIYVCTLKMKLLKGIIANHKKKIFIYYKTIIIYILIVAKKSKKKKKVIQIFMFCTT